MNRIADWLRWLAARFRSTAPSRWWLLSILIGGLYNLSYKHLYRIYFNLIYSCEAILLRRVLGRIASPLIVSLGTPINIITLRACKKSNSRIVISERNDPKRLSRMKNWDVLARKFYNRADLVTANTRGALRDMSGFVEDAKLAFVPNPLVLLNSDGHQPVSAQAPTILNVGRMVSDKAQSVLLDAFAQLGDEFNEWRLSIVGDGYLKDILHGQAVSLGINGRLDWHGVVADPYLHYRQAQVFALPSRVEGTPNALLEAMSCGLPVIVSDGAPGPLELIEDGVTGLVVPVNDAAALATALGRLASDEKLRRRLGAAGRERVSEYELSRSLAKWESVVGLEPMEQSAVHSP
jgi:glycosyltransferase involved in cell wall biosynthesis